MISGKKTQFENKHVRILREALASLHKKAPPLIQKRITTALTDFAKAIDGVCQCEETVYIDNEKAHACLNCGKRHKDLEVVK